MKGNSTAFYFDGVSSDSFAGTPFHGHLTNDMYTDQMLGNRTIIETLIPGRESPYFYGVDEQPLQFTMTIAFEDYVTIAEARRVARWLLAPRTYKTLKFENDEDKEYEVIFVGAPTFTYVGTKEESDQQLIGHMDLTARSNYPYAFTTYHSMTRQVNGNDTDDFMITNKGDDRGYLDLVIIAGEYATGSIRIKNKSNSSEIIIYSINPYEKVVVNYSQRTITRYEDTNAPNQPPTYEQGDPIYESWNRYWVYIDEGANNMEIETLDNSFEVELIYRAPRYI